MTAPDLVILTQEITVQAVGADWVRTPHPHPMTFGWALLPNLELM